MRRLALLAVGAILIGGGFVIVAAGAVLGGSYVGLAGGDDGGGPPAIPFSWELLDRQAASAVCPGLPWSVLAAIGRVESDSGRSTLPGVHSGANSAGAEGPMQFEPSTFAEYATVGPGGARPASPYDPVDAVYTAARMLCADGARNDLRAAVFDYNHTDGYVSTVLVLAAALFTAPMLGSEPAVALAFAAASLGIPYVWGGIGPAGYDCSGLVMVAYHHAGVDLPRTAEQQFQHGPPVTIPEPGDLVFYGASSATVEHVGIYVAGGQMINAPHTGTVVRIEGIGRPFAFTRPSGPTGTTAKAPSAQTS